MDDLKVLFVDDEQELVTTVLERLHFRGVAAVGATSANQALEIIRRERFDVVLLDVRMPGLDGLGMIKILKRENPDLPVIFLTGHGSKEDAEEGLRSGAHDYLMKPIDLDHLLELVAKVTESQRKARREEPVAPRPQRGDLEFISQVVTDQSHEMTNVLNNMNEILGLAKDAVASELQPTPAVQDRLNSYLQRVDGQLRRGVEVSRSINRFGHALDTTVIRVDLDTAIAHSIDLLERRARYARVRVESTTPSEVCEIDTIPVLLYEALRRCMAAGIMAAEGGGLLRVSHRACDGGALVTVESEHDIPSTTHLGAVLERLKIIVEDLGARLVAFPGDGQDRRFELHLPPSPDPLPPQSARPAPGHGKEGA